MKIQYSEMSRRGLKKHLYVDENIKAVVNGLEQTFNAPTFDPTRVGYMANGIGLES